MTTSLLPLPLARAMLNVLPPTMWFIRRQVRTCRLGLSMTHYRTLAIVGRKPTVNLTEVAQNLGESLPTASRLVHSLVKRGLLQRTDCSQDRRKRELTLTPQGRSSLDTMRARTQAEVAKKLDALTNDQRAALALAMEALGSTFGTAGMEALSATASTPLQASPAPRNLETKRASRSLRHVSR